ncbi:MAG: DMT family transporter [Cyclobacteriaceae bacterium]|nr:DMT family transporter [Cyclobacteriaceae bacterium]
MSKGLRYMLVAVLFFAAMNVLIKFIPRIGPVEIVFFRSIVSFLISFFMLHRLKVSVWGNNKKWLIIRGIAGSIGLLLFFTTIKQMPLGSAVAIQYLSPIFTSVLGIYIVKERVYSIQWLFFLVSFAGVIIIQGFDPRVTQFQLVIGVCSALASGMAYNSIRKLKLSEHPLVIIFYFPLITIPLTGVYMLFTAWTTPNLMELVILVLIGLATQFAQYFMTKAYQLEELSKVSSVQYVGIVFALLFGFVLFDESYTLKSFVGIVIVLTGVVLNVVFKSRIDERS